MEKKKYRIACWVPIGSGLGEWETKEEAQKELKRLEKMQLENKYEIEEVIEE